MATLEDGFNQVLADFKKRLKSVGADFPDPVVENMDRLILSMHPKHKRKSKSTSKAGDAAATNTVVDKQKRLFPGLALPDQAVESPYPSEAKDATMVEVDNLMKELEGVAKKPRQPT